MLELSELIKLSQYAGERFDLIQAGGGNSSVKDSNGLMYIKSSGYQLSEVNENQGYTLIDNSKILHYLAADEVEQSNWTLILDEATSIGQRASIEVVLHSLLAKYTLHTHPLSVNIITATKNWQEQLLEIFEEQDVLLIPYKTPGLELGLLLKSELSLHFSKFNVNPKFIFLQNHGLVVSSDNLEELKALNDYVVSKVDDFLGMDFARYKLTNKISQMVNSIKEEDDSDYVSYLSEDNILNNFLKENFELLFTLPFCPDKMVYCSTYPVIIDSFNDFDAFLTFKRKQNDVPKIVMYEDHIFFVGKSIKKCREVEEVFKFHLLVIKNIPKDQINHLSVSEYALIANLEAEKYRQKI